MKRIFEVVEVDVMIPKELIKALRTIEIHTSRRQRAAGRNLHVRLQGSESRFREVRQYQPGDDVRTIDWNVSARMNETFVKSSSKSAR